MNIPRHFYGMNYMSKLMDNFQDSELASYNRIAFHEIEDVKPIPLMNKDTISLGLNAAGFSMLLRNVTTNRRCRLDGIAVARGENLLFARYRAPYSEEIPRMTNSTCKTVTAIAVMFAMEEGLLKEEDYVLSYFKEYESKLTPKFVRKMTIRHLLMMTSCSKCTELASVVETDWVKAFLLTDCECEPGSKFIYNSMNTYMLAAILTSVTGMSVMEYLRPRLWEPLGINHIKWELCPKGIERGGWGLHISLEGMLKIGMFLMNNGCFQGKQLINASYILKMKRSYVKQDADAFAIGYGYQLWHLSKGRYMLSGMYGQNVIIDEPKKLIVATNAHCDKMFPDSSLVRYIIDAMDKKYIYGSDPLLREKWAWHKLMQELEMFGQGWKLQKVNDRAPFILYVEKQKQRKERECMYLQYHLSGLNGKRLHIDRATVKLFPYMLQGMYSCPPFHVTDITFKVQDDFVKVCFYKERSKKERREGKKREHIVLEAGIAEYRYQTIAIGMDERQLAVKMHPATDEDGYSVIMLNIVFLDAGFSRLMKFFLMDDCIEIECQEYPDIRAIMEQVIYGETSLAGKRIDLTNILPESIRVILERKVEPKVDAYLRE